MEFDFCLHLHPVNTGTKVGNKNQQIRKSTAFDLIDQAAAQIIKI